MIYFVDFEASSLFPGSFPIEVGWVNKAGSAESYLIRPHSDWLKGGCQGWSAQSEAVHGISLDTLLRDGTPIEHVAARAVEVLSGPGVVAYTDQPGWDGMWLDSLLDYGGMPGRIILHDVKEAYEQVCSPLLRLLSAAGTSGVSDAERRVSFVSARVLARAREQEALRSGTHHRAAADAESLWRIWQSVEQLVRQEIAQDGQ